MTTGFAIPLAVLLSSLVPAIIIFLLREDQHRLRTICNVAGAVVKLGLTSWMLLGVYQGHTFETRLPFLPDADLLLHADSFSLIFVTLSAFLWLLTTIYAVGYLEGSPDRSRFFGFFSLCVTATMGIAMAGNLLTFFFFYEILTLTTYPLVIHRGSEEALAAGDTYLRYTLAGGAALLAGVALLYAVAGPVEFTEGGALRGLEDTARPVLVLAFALLVGGLGVKAALVPLHAWLPAAMVAPAPVSALLHAVAVVKAGAFGITRVVYDVFGANTAHRLGVTRPLAVIAGVTIIYGSFRALTETKLKRMLAYSTVSQLSYIIIGVAVPGILLTVGGVVHIVHQGLMKITMFFCAGNLSEELGVREIEDMRGVGRRMPVTMAAFTVAALGTIGVPPMAGFITKWYLGAGAIESREYWVLGVLIASSLLNAAYFLPVLYRAWFAAPALAFPSRPGRLEIRPTLLLPTVAGALASIAVGALAAVPLSPLGWARIVAARELGP